MYILIFGKNKIKRDKVDTHNNKQMHLLLQTQLTNEPNKDFIWRSTGCPS